MGLTETAIWFGSVAMMLGASIVTALLAILAGLLWKKAIILWAKNFNSTTAKTKAWIEFCGWRNARKNRGE